MVVFDCAVAMDLACSHSASGNDKIGFSRRGGTPGVIIVPLLMIKSCA